MGASQSDTRKITVDNPDDKSTVIKITENVVGRLREEPIINRTKLVDPTTVVDNKSIGDVSSEFKTCNNVEDSAYVTSRHIRRQLANEIESNNSYWENRLNALHNGYRQINEELERAYETSIVEVNGSSTNQNAVNRRTAEESSSLCQVARRNVIQCYNLNGTQLLSCSKELENFNECACNGMKNTLLTAE